MQLPTVLHQLINKYNENGFFVLAPNLKDIYWTNGKQFQLWYTSLLLIMKILYTQYRLFMVDRQNYHLFEIKNNKMKKCENIGFNWMRSSQLIFDYRWGSNQIVRCNFECYDFQFFPFRKTNDLINYIEVSKKQYMDDRAFLKCHGLHLYYFGRNKHEKFDTLTSKWSTFTSENKSIFTVCLWNHLFYVIYYDHLISIYNPVTDTWVKTQNKVPF